MKDNKNINGFGDFLKENYPAGAGSDSNAPWNQEDLKSNRGYDIPDADLNFELLVTDNKEFAIIKDKKSSIEYMLSFDSSDEDFKEFIAVPFGVIGNDDDGLPEYEYDWENAEVDDKAILLYASYEVKENGFGDGADDFEEGMVSKIDAELAEDVIEMMENYSNDPEMVKKFIDILSKYTTGINEGEGLHPAIRQKLLDFMKENPTATYAETRNHISDKIKGWKLTEEDFEEAKKLKC